jgi:hypothetical protein
LLFFKLLPKELRFCFLHSFGLVLNSAHFKSLAAATDQHFCVLKVCVIRSYQQGIFLQDVVLNLLASFVIVVQKDLSLLRKFQNVPLLFLKSPCALLSEEVLVILVCRLPS